MYKILDDYLLSNPNKIEEKVSSLNGNTLRSLYEDTQKYYERNLTSIISEFQSKEGINVYPSGLVQYPEARFIDLSKRLCLYADKIVLHDPVYGILQSMHIGLKEDFVKNELKRILKYYLELRELVDNKILYYVPYEKIVLPADHEISEVARADCSEPSFRKICFENIEVGLDRKKTDELSYSFIFTRLGQSIPSVFTVGLHFHVPKGVAGSIVLTMSPGRPFELTTAERTIELKPLRVSKNIMVTDEQIKNQIEHLLYWQAKEINSSLYFSKLFNACSITNFDVMWKLLNWKFGNLDKELKTISTLLEIDLKFLDNIEAKNILKVRSKEESVFEDFRQSFKDVCREITSTPYTNNFRKETVNLKKEKIDPELRKLDRAFKRIKKYRFIRGAVIGIGTLSGVALGPIGIPVLGGGLAAILREYAEYDKELSKLKENSLYFLWKLKS